MTRAGIIGCGSMGGCMARHLHASGIRVSCFDADERIRSSLVADGLDVAACASAVCNDIDLLILSLPHAAAVEQVMSGIHTVIASATVVLDTSTSEPATSQRWSQRAAERGYAFIDAPVSGGPAAAANGTMTMLLGGDMKALLPVEPVLDVLASRRVPVGGSGSGHAAKIANNMLCAANLVLVAEAIRLAEAAGVSAQSLLDGVNAGSGRSGVSEVNYPRWILNEAYDSGFTMRLMRKDVNLALALAEQSDTALPAFDGIARLWNDSRDVIDDTADFNRIHGYTVPGP